MNLFEILALNARNTSSILMSNGSEYVSSDSFLSATLKRAAYLKHNGITKNSKVALLIENDFELAYYYFALWALGAVTMPINLHLTKENLRKQFEIVKPDFYVGDCLDTYEISGINIPNQLDVTEAALKPIDSNHCAAIMFTSGTSGLPKAVPLTHQMLYKNSLRSSELLQLDVHTKWFINTPFYTMSSLIHLLTILHARGTLFINREFLFGESIVDFISKNNCTGFGGVPLHFQRLASAITPENSKRLTSLIKLMNSGDHLPPTIIDELTEKLPSIKIYCAYGLTECSGRFCFLPPDKLKNKQGSVGSPLTGMQLQILDEAYSPLPAKQIGEVFIKGDLLMKGYLNASEKNASLLTKDGFATGDMGYLDEDGYLFLKGRSDDIIKVGGEKVSLRAIEDCAQQVAGVEACLCRKIDDPHIGACVELQFKAHENSSIKRKNVVLHLRKNLAKHWMPAKVAQVDDFSRTASGKIKRKI